MLIRTISATEEAKQSMDTVEMTDCETLKLNAQKSSKLEGFWKAALRGTDYKIHHSIEMPVNYEINYTFKRTKT